MRYLARWEHTLDELKHGRRFFSPAARALFSDVFHGIEELRAGPRQPVVKTLRAGTRLYRARICPSRAALKDFFAAPMKEIGPPPREQARAGRMNADGVVVLYAAKDSETCLAEMRPAIGNETAVICLELTQPLRVLDFTRLEAARSRKSLSYFQPDFRNQLELHAFLRHLHKLISQPVVPGHEVDYLITQTMSEYLAHVHEKPFDGVLFASAQRAGGVNVVLFPQPDLLSNDPAAIYRAKYVDGSIKLISTNAIRYIHEDLNVVL